MRLKITGAVLLLQLSLIAATALADFSLFDVDDEDKYDDSCETDAGYELIDGVCKPTCSSGCPHGHCEDVNWCRCDDGFKSVDGSCLAIEQCAIGFVWNEALEICLPQQNYQKTTRAVPAVIVPNKVSVVWTHVTPVYLDALEEQKIKVSEEVGSPLWPIVLSETSTAQPEETHVEHNHEKEHEEEHKHEHEHEHNDEHKHEHQHEHNHKQEHQPEVEETPLEEVVEEEEEEYKCSHGFIYYKGDCRPRIYTQNDCNPDLCGLNMHCTESGDYECLPGFHWEHDSLAERASCVPSDATQLDNWLKRLRVPLENFDEVIKKVKSVTTERVPRSNYKIEKVEIAQPEQSSSWVDNFFTALGVTCVVLAVLCLLLIFYRNSRK